MLDMSAPAAGEDLTVLVDKRARPSPAAQIDKKSHIDTDIFHIDTVISNIDTDMLRSSSISILSSSISIVV